MQPRRRPLPFQSWPDRLQLAERHLEWVERERSLALWMHGASTRRGVERFFRIVSRIGDGWIWPAVMAGLFALGGAVGHSASIRMFAVTAVNLVLYWIIKRWIARPRPFITCPGIRECQRSLDEFSFPSGHTLHSVAFSVILTAYYPLAAFIVWPFTLLVAWSRIVLGLHYPSDVIVGGLIGLATALVSFNLL